jgi:probable phosphoglycerate mutase
MQVKEKIKERWTDRQKTIVYIIRHGETEWNRIGKQQGHLNSDLTENGKKQARAIANYLDNYFELIISSDLGRAVQTAEIIAKKLKTAVFFDCGLRERNLGIIQGLTIKEFAASFPKEYEQFNSSDPDYVIPKGESIRQRFTRVMAALNKIGQAYKNRKILVVAHGGVLDSLFRHTVSMPLEAKRSFSLINGSINIFTNKEFWNLELWGYLDHLKGLQALDDF